MKTNPKNVRLFIEQNQETWSQLEVLLEELGRRPTKDQLSQLGSLYRQVSSHFAYAQTYFRQHETTHYLQSLVIRSHNIMYGAKKKNQWQPLIHFYLHKFPTLFYERAPFFLTALILLLFGFMIAYILTMIYHENSIYFLGNMTPLHPDEIINREWNPAIASSTIMVNNIYVAFLCFAWGALFGIGTVWTLIVNGMMIGSLAALYVQMNSSYIFWAYILPHGMIELTAIFIAGAAGLSLAYRFFVPGTQTRFQSFKQEGKVTIQLIFGVIPLFIFAAIIEGYITPATIPHWGKYLFSAFTLLALLVYFGRPFWKEGIINEPDQSSSDEPDTNQSKPTATT